MIHTNSWSHRDDHYAIARQKIIDLHNKFYKIMNRWSFNIEANKSKEVTLVETKAGTVEFF